jgi:hypothetical protein
MIDIGFKIPQIGQYIMYIIGGLLILAGIIVGIVSIIKSRHASKSKENQENIFDEGKPRRRRTGK